MKPFRKERLASVIRDIVSETLANRMNDPRIEPLTTVTRVAMSGDLMIATIHLTVHGDMTAERKTLIAVRHAKGFIQRIVAQELTIRQCPELRFEIDQVANRSREILDLLQRNREAQPEIYKQDSKDPSQSNETSTCETAGEVADEMTSQRLHHDGDHGADA